MRKNLIAPKRPKKYYFEFMHFKPQGWIRLWLINEIKWLHYRVYSLYIQSFLHPSKIKLLPKKNIFLLFLPSSFAFFICFFSWLLSLVITLLTYLTLSPFKASKIDKFIDINPEKNLRIDSKIVKGNFPIS